ncbi:spermidine/putrescine transport system ATP-binding protein [Faunimonas pinastri]|uniref:Spermidine/putrescine transport system ATP-binding protein n=1 Tax=Faunimonas pinastri TaxID=1855383 RepID=A0A1H9AB07_9HYPH|nr:ABC transporter ATP-binding protein [Faunimonas pinastri]SEP73854.1 spermidine/putrescine transport system ATP-binding protein [Faunimonas pinastri]
MSQGVTLDRVSMRFGSFTAVDDVSLDIRPGEFFSFLGPSGCGKTTILRLISGFSEPTSGQVLIGGKDMRGVGANKRPTAMIFQNLALFPLMSVAENIAFGLEVRGLSRTERRRKADELLDLIALPGIGDRAVAELSGGQRQRVAIARALAVEPTVLLLDEPLSALDLKLRQHMRTELRAIQKRTGVTFIYITHDQGEALTMSDRVAVMSQGRIEQVGAPQEIYESPETAFAAGFVGETNAFPGIVHAADSEMAVIDTKLGQLRARNCAGLSGGEAAVVFVRPERLLPADDGILVRVREKTFEGSFIRVVGEGQDGVPVVAQITNAGDLPDLRIGSETRLRFHPRQAVALRPAPHG